MGKKSATLCHLGSKLDLFLYRHLIKRVPFRLLNCGNKLPWQQIWFLMSSDQIKLLLKYQNDRPEKYGVYSCVTIKKSRIWSANYYKSHRWLKYIYIYIYTFGSRNTTAKPSLIFQLAREVGKGCAKKKVMLNYEFKYGQTFKIWP